MIKILIKSNKSLKSFNIFLLNETINNIKSLSFIL